MNHCAIEIGRADDGSIDAVVARGCAVHIERMHAGTWYLGVMEPDGSYYAFVLTLRRGVELIAAGSRPPPAERIS